MASESVASSSENVVQFLPLEHSTSKIWKYFGFPARDGIFLETDKRKRNEVTCKVCKKKFKYSGNTSNMRLHLQSSHPTDFALMQTTEDHGTSSRKRSSEMEGKSQMQQLRLPGLFAGQFPFQKSNPRWRKLTESVCYFLAKDMLPFDTVNDPGFRHMINVFEPRYIPPDRKTISTHYMPELYEKGKEKIQQHLDGVKWYAITTDMWTSRAKQAFSAITVHYVTNEFKLQSHLLETREFPESHTGVNIAQEIEEVLGEWKLPLQGIIAATTDNGANITSAIEMLECPHLPCFSHTLQLAVEQALKISEVAKMIAKCKRLVTHFNHSSKSYYLLHQKQIALNHKQLSLIQDVVTRWNSVYYMVDRILHQQQPLCATLLELKKGDLMPTDRDFSTMELFVQVMKPLVDITEALGAQKFVTISTVRALLYKLFNNFLKPADSDSRLMKMMKLKMQENLHDCYAGPTLDLLSKAAFLDPRFKSLTFLITSEKQRITEELQEEAAILPDTEDQDEPTPPQPKVSRGKKKLLHLLEDIIQPSSGEISAPEISASEKAKREIARYVADEEVVDWEDCSLLEWWERSKHRYPHLAKLAMKYLSIPATSVPSERAFSTAGHIVNEKRACLLPENVSMLVFLASNLQ